MIVAKFLKCQDYVRYDEKKSLAPLKQCETKEKSKLILQTKKKAPLNASLTKLLKVKTAMVLFLYFGDVVTGQQIIQTHT